MVQRFRQEGYHRRFAVAAGHGEYRFVVQAGKEFNIVDLLRVRVGEGGAAAVNARADHQRPGTGERLRVVKITFFDAALVEAFIEADGVVACLAQEVERDMAGCAHAYDKNRFSERQRPQFAGHRIHVVFPQRSFRVERPISTSITVIIQKRMVTRDSGQPQSSK